MKDKEIKISTIGDSIMYTYPYNQLLLNTLIDTRVHTYYWEEDLSCVLTTLKILSEIFSCKPHPQVLAAAYGLNAGRLASQCGLVEGALLYMGVYGEIRGLNTHEIKECCHGFSSQFHKEFGSVLCSELRKEGFNPDNPPHLCEKLTKEAIAFSVEFIDKKINHFIE